MFSGRFVLLLLFGISALAGANHPALAQDAEKKPATPAADNSQSSAKLVSSNWNLECHPSGPEQKLACEISKKVALEKTRKILLTVFITPRNTGKGAEAYILRYQLPHGLNLANGVKMQIDEGKPMSPVIVTSSPAGAFARQPMNDVLLASLKKGTVMTVSFSAINGTGLSIPVSPVGFSAVYAKLK